MGSDKFLNHDRSPKRKTRKKFPARSRGGRKRRILRGEHTRDFFAVLVEKVSGIGPKIALNMLSRMSAASLKSAIIAGDVSLLSKCPGIGRKTAERLVLELRGAFGSPVSGGVSELPQGASNPTNVSDALAALVALGVKPADADKAVRAAVAKLGADANAEELIRLSLSSK